MGLLNTGHTSDRESDVEQIKPPHKEKTGAETRNWSPMQKRDVYPTKPLHPPYWRHAQQRPIAHRATPINGNKKGGADTGKNN